MTFDQILIFIATLFILRPFTTFLHEMGHAIPTLLYTQKGVTIYIGSYGDPQKSMFFNLGRLTIFFKYNPLLWDYGLCVREQIEISIDKAILILLMGPLFSLLMGAASLYIALFGRYPDSITFVSMMIAISCLLDFYQNIVPNEKPSRLHNGTEVHNDGQQIKQLFKYHNLPKEYDTYIDLYNNNKFETASIGFEKILTSGYKRDFVYRVAISSYLQIHQYAKAAAINEAFIKRYKNKLTAIDYYTCGQIKSYQNDHNAAISAYSRSIQLDKNNVYSLNNRGYTYNLIGQYNKAIKDFNRVITLEKSHAYAMNNRGLSKVKLGDLENGIIDIKKSLQLDDTNSYCYMNLGIYYEEIHEYKKALEYLETAFELDKKTHLLVDHIDRVKKKLNGL